MLLVCFFFLLLYVLLAMVFPNKLLLPKLVARAEIKITMFALFHLLGYNRSQWPFARLQVVFLVLPVFTEIMVFSFRNLGKIPVFFKFGIPKKPVFHVGIF